MNRRGFIQIASAALAGIPFLRSAFASPAPKLGTTWGGLVISGEFGKVGLHYRIPQTVKVTGLWARHGFESAPYECEVNESAYIELPKIRSPHVMIGGAYGDSDVRWHEVDSSHVFPDRYRIYAPQHGFEKTGPWYLFKEVSYRDAKRARFTIAVEYQDSDLIAQLAPGDYERLTAVFPPADYYLR